MDKLEDYQLNNDVLEFDKLKKVKGYFTINHYAGKVEYNTENFINKNNNKISDDIYQFIEENIEYYQNKKFNKNKKQELLRHLKVI